MEIFFTLDVLDGELNQLEWNYDQLMIDQLNQRGLIKFDHNLYSYINMLHLIKKVQGIFRLGKHKMKHIGTRSMCVCDFTARCVISKSPAQSTKSNLHWRRGRSPYSTQYKEMNCAINSLVRRIMEQKLFCCWIFILRPKPFDHYMRKPSDK